MATRGRWRALAAIVLAGALILTGCSGDGAREDFAATFGDDATIAGIELSTADNMPFTGGVSAEVRAQAGATDAQLRALTDRLSAFAHDRADTDVRITLVADEATVPVFADAGLSARVLARAQSLRADERVASVALTSRPGEDRVSGVSVGLTGDDGAEAFALARSLPEVLADVTRSGRLHLTVRGADEAVRIQGDAGAWIDDAERAWTAVAGAVPTTGLHAEPERLEVTLAREVDVAAAAAAASAAPGAPAVVFASPLVDLGAGASGDAARALLAALDDARLSEVRTLWTDDGSIDLTVDSPARAASLAQAVSARPEASAFAAITVTAGAADDVALRVTAAPPLIGDRVAAAAAALRDTGAVSLVSAPRAVTLTVAGDASDEMLEEDLAVLRGLQDDGARLCANRADGTGVCVAGAPPT
ncbi:hypothetical protein AB0N73_00480 [Microbacterium sp. NPDC089189]|uniref:hypothetical protein n=1 Tax=Microbacterium sp. NPDC089189 TaxID=3154972 RepID=UPI003427B0A4